MGIPQSEGRVLMPHPTIAQIREGLEGWQARFGDRLQVSVPAQSVGGRDVLLARVTDHSVPDGDKQVVLLTCTHAGREVNSTTSCLRFLRWLLGEDDLARETRRRQIVLAFPAAAPDAYDEMRPNGPGNTCMGYWGWDGVMRPDINPEAVAIAQVMDEYLPDVHVDMHGFPEADSSMPESTGISWGSGLARCYVPRVPELMNEAADEAGFGVTATNGEWAGGMILSTGPLAAPYRPSTLTDEDLARLEPGLAADRFFYRPPNISGPVYSYQRYHTLGFVMEIGFEQSALVRLQRLMCIGNERWPTEPVAGYPVNHFGHGLNVALAGYGATAHERRQSRCEIWRNLGQFMFGYGNVPSRGDLVAVVATCPEGARRYFGVEPGRAESMSGAPSGQVEHFDKLLGRMEGSPRFDMPAIREFMATVPVTHYMAFGGPMGLPEQGVPIERGLGVRLQVPYADARVTRVLLDGRPLAEGSADGWAAWGGSGTTVQVNLPPDAVRDFHLIQLRYDADDSARPCGWTEADWDV